GADQTDDVEIAERRRVTLSPALCMFVEMLPLRPPPPPRRVPSLYRRPAADAARRRRIEDSLTLGVRLAIGDPLGRRIALEVVAKPLELPVQIVGLALRARDVVILALVHEIDHVLAQPPAEVVQLLALKMVHVAVG